MQFQFQYGAIESCCIRSMSVVYLYFNSSMVRLKVKIKPFPGAVNSISIPVWCDWKEKVRSIYKEFLNFNSSMVRLKAACFSSRKTPSLFQFQYGAIESNLLLSIFIVTRHFNSSMVRLKVKEVYGGYYKLIDISIPVWCDWKRRRKGWYKILYRISIPVWCDWKTPSFL